MNVYPILAALRRHKVAALLIVLQVALTLAIVVNALCIVGHNMAQISHPSGIEEDGLIRILQLWPTKPVGDDAAKIEQLDVLQRTDLETLRHLPDVQDVAASSNVPLWGGEYAGDISLDAERKGKFVHAAYYYGDERLRPTFGVHLIAGRDFLANEIRHGHAAPGSAVIIVSKPVADQLFPDGSALGQTVYQDDKPAKIVGIVEPLRTPFWGDWHSEWDFNSVIEPLREDDLSAGYVVRARPGRTKEAIREIHKALFAVNPMRLMPESHNGYVSAGIHPFSEIRFGADRPFRGMAMLMGLVCLIVLSVTAAGIVGLTSFWVVQRYRQIGVRRALGARKIDIQRYFQIENLLIAGGGTVLGALFAVVLNEWLMTHYEVTRLPLLYLAAGVLAMLALGQAAVLVPARRASNVPPVVATRSV